MEIKFKKEINSYFYFSVLYFRPPVFHIWLVRDLYKENYTTFGFTPFFHLTKIERFSYGN